MPENMCFCLEFLEISISILLEFEEKIKVLKKKHLSLVKKA